MASNDSPARLLACARPQLIDHQTATLWTLKGSSGTKQLWQLHSECDDVYFPRLRPGRRGIPWTWVEFQLSDRGNVTAYTVFPDGDPRFSKARWKDTAHSSLGPTALTHKDVTYGRVWATSVWPEGGFVTWELFENGDECPAMIYKNYSTYGNALSTVQGYNRQTRRKIRICRDFSGFLRFICLAPPEKMTSMQRSE